jgi:glycosyltransferase involved in cell wall biosynthesis
MKNNLLSIIMAVKDNNEFLDQCILSILKQSYKKFIFIIIDDAAKKKVKEKIQFYRDKDKRIKIIKNKKNQGLTISLIKAINHAKSKFIARIDSDDFCHPDRIKKQMEWIQKSNKRVLCGSNYFLIKKKHYFKKNILSGYKKIKRNILFKNCFVHSSTLFRYKAYKTVGGYNPKFKYSQDYDLWSRLSNIGVVDNLNERLTYIRDQKKSVSNLKKNEQTINSIIISCNNFHYSKKMKFFKIFKDYRKNLKYIKSLKFLSNFYNSIVFLNRKKLKKNFYIKIHELNWESLTMCLRQPKMFIYTLIS